MPRSTQVFTQLPWRGGINTAVDEGAIPPDDLIQADNVQFATSGARIKREGFDYFDSDIPTLLGRSSSGTTRTLVFTSALTSATDDVLVSGEKITVSGDSNYEGDFTVASITTNTPSATNFVDGDVSVANDTITETSHGYYTGMLGQFTTTGTLPAGLSLSTNFYCIRVDANTYKVAISLDDAIAGTAVDITGASGGGSHTFTPTTVSNNAITYTASTSVAESLTDSSETITKNYSIIGLHDYWYLDSNVKTQRLVAISDEPKWYWFDSNGNRKEIAAAGGATALSSPTKANMITANNVLIASFDGTANTPKKYDPANSATWDDLGGSPPNFEFAQMHLGRLFANDKTDPDRLHYSPPGDVETWGGTKDSGAIDIFPGDGDPRGITAIGRPFKGRMFVGKSTKLIDLRGDSPENFRPVPVTEGQGMLSHGAVVAVDFDDLAYISSRGIHSAVATDTQGDFASNYLSAKIQPSFDDFDRALLSDSRGIFFAELNSVAYIVASTEASTELDDVYLFNIIEKEWYKWPSVNAQSIAVRQVGTNDEKMVMGNNAGRIIQAQNGTRTDFGSTGPAMTVKTGFIYPGNDPQSMKMFKRLYLYFKAQGDFSFTVKYKIDTQDEQTLTFEPTLGEEVLGTDFVLGTTELGVRSVFAPQAQMIEGIGRGIQLTVESTGSNRPIEIYGYGIEYEIAGLNQEVLNEG